MPRPFLLLYGSETGQAESIAQDLASAAPDKGFEPQLCVLNDVDKKFVLEKARCPVVIITSTTGEGDPPDNARKFVRKFKRRTLANTYLAHLNYTVLGLGDTNYENFCNCGKTMDARLAELGGKRFYACAWADDAVGLDLTVEPWLKGLWSALDGQGCAENGHAEKEEEEEESKQEKEVEKEAELEELRQRFAAMEAEADLLGDEEAAKLSGVELSVPQLPAAFLAAEVLPEGSARLDPDTLMTHNGQAFAACDGGPLKARATCCRLLTAPSAVKPSFLLRVQLEPPSELAFEPGDAVALLRPNTEAEVTELLTRLGALEQADMPLRLRVRQDPARSGRAPVVPVFLPPEGASLRQLLLYCLDLRAPPDKLLLRVLAEACTAPREKRRLLELASTQGRLLHQQLLREQSRTLADVLRAFPSCQPAVARLLERMKRLPPRPYSACCSPLASDAVEFAASLVTIPEAAHRAARRGLLTGWMEELARGSEDRQVWVLRRRTNNFRLPEAPASGKSPPLVLVGAGTGVSPFRGFLQHLQSAWRPENRPDVWLFFGCRQRTRDCLFGSDLEAWRDAGLLSRLSIVCSRETSDANNRYVQHRMRAEAAELGSWFRSGARLYVCGDATGMAPEVRQVAAEILASENGVSTAEGEKLFARMRLDRRYFEDVWS